MGMKPFVITLALVLAVVAFGETQVSVKDFGAKGDGIADDTAAIQRALDAFCGDKFTIATATGAGVSRSW
jgi:polygalacturonase